MSRIGNNPIKIEDNVKVEIKNKTVTVVGPKGTLMVELPWNVDAKVVDGNIIVTRQNEEKIAKSLHGTMRSLIANAVYGVSHGYEKVLEIVGVGYRAKKEGNKISIALGWTHPVVIEPAEGIEFDVPDENTIVIRGIDKQKVGEWAAKIRAIKKPEPYKGKGIRYRGEYVRRKSAKTVEAT
jgi:large subunit ribosomal protein L6